MGVFGVCHVCVRGYVRVPEPARTPVSLSLWGTACGRLWLHLCVCICLCRVPACSLCPWLRNGTGWGRSVLEVGEAAGGLVSQPGLGASSLLRRTRHHVACVPAGTGGGHSARHGRRWGEAGSWRQARRGGGERSSEFSSGARPFPSRESATHRHLHGEMYQPRPL